MKHQILIFTTSVSRKKEIRQIRNILEKNFNISGFSLDFDDWEKILRIECTDVSESEIIAKLSEINH